MGNKSVNGIKEIEVPIASTNNKYTTQLIHQLPNKKVRSKADKREV